MTLYLVAVKAAFEIRRRINVAVQVIYRQTLTYLMPYSSSRPTIESFSSDQA